MPVLRKRYADFNELLKVLRREKTDKPVLFEIFFDKEYYEFFSGKSLDGVKPNSLEELKQQIKSYTPGKTSLKDKLKKATDSSNPIGRWTVEKEDSCYICNYFKEHYDRYLDTFFIMYKRDEAFRAKIQNGKGFCLPHFGDLCQASETKLNDHDRKAFYDCISKLMLDNMDRLYEDVAWLIEKFDYRNKDADWKNSKDAVPRAMQKLKGGYPADPVYKMNK